LNRTVDGFRHDRWTGFAAITLAAALLAAPRARAQEDPVPADSPVNLSAKAVSELKVKIEPPDYPAVAKVNYIQGKVRLRILVSREGRVTRVHVIKGHPFLAAAAIEAVQKWVYRPYRLGKWPVEFTTLVSVNFWLRSKVLMDIPAGAERDLRARIDPPEVLDQPADPPSDTHVRLRVLVDSKGHALDAQNLSGNESDARIAEQEVSQWKFRPAHWGTLPVAWYLEVNVPVHHWPA
jgi:TonB family protein